MTNAMGGAHLHTPRSIFQHMMGQQNSPQEPGPWMPMPQVPSLSIPWSVPSLQQPELVRFTGGTSFETILHQKRKLEVPDLLDTRQTKQFITEEKMAAHFKDLHISTNYQSQTPTPSTSTADTQSVPAKELNMDLDIEATNVANVDESKLGHPRLVLSDELKRLQQEPILPSSLLSKLERPSMALVLWEPPSKHPCILPVRDTPTPIPTASDNDNNNNNTEGIPDLNQPSTSNSTMSDVELMEL